MFRFARSAHKAADPCAVCDHGRWGRYEETDCEQEDRTIESATVPGLRPGGMVPKPGDMLALVIAKVTGIVAGNCACAQRQQTMNQNGWLWCLRNRKIILGWLREEAERLGHPMSDGELRPLLVAAFKEAAKRE